MAEVLDRGEMATEAPVAPSREPPPPPRNMDRPPPPAPRGKAPEPTPASKKMNPRKKRIILLVVGAVLLAGIVAAIIWYLHARNYVSTDDAFINAHIITMSPQVPGRVATVNVLENQFVTRGTILMTIDPRDYQAALARATAQLAAAKATASQFKSSLALTHRTAKAAAAEGKALITIAKANVAAAKTGIATAKSQLAEAKARVAAAKAGVAQAQAQVVADQAQARKTSQDLARYVELLKTGDVTPQAVDSERAASESAAAYLDAARTAVTASRSMVTQSLAAQEASVQGILQARAALAEAQARVVRADAQYSIVNVAPQRISVSQHKYSTSQARLAGLQAEITQARLNLGYTTIKAPCDGWVTRKAVEPGDYVQVGQSAMAIVKPDMWVIANFKETDLTDMRPGQPVSISIDAYPNRNYEGKVASIQAGTGSRFSLLPPENATGNYVKVVQRVPVKILFDNQPSKKDKLAAGMSVEPDVKIH